MTGSQSCSTMRVEAARVDTTTLLLFALARRHSWRCPDPTFSTSSPAASPADGAWASHVREADIEAVYAGGDATATDDWPPGTRKT